MRPPIPRIGPPWRVIATGLLIFTVLFIGAVRADAATYPNPGVVTGAITGVHGRAMIKAPNGTYILVSAGNWPEIRTSTDRTNLTRVGSVWAPR
jgi:arabinan endo-1,5-alpha-L-arabinosidase